MRQNNLSLWKYNSSLNCLLFFAQRLDELLFHHTTDTYRYSTLSLQGLAVEYCKVYKDVQNGILNKKNLAYIIDEFSERLKNDTIAKEILTEEFVERFLKNYASWTTKEQYENIRYIGRTFGNRHYYNHIVSKLKELIKENKKKKELDEKTSLFVRELLDCGYNANYIFQMLHEVFFHKEVSSLDSLNVFLAKFDFVEKKYDVYIDYSSDMSSLLPLFDKLDSSDIKISVINTAEKLVQTCMTDIVRWNSSFFNNKIVTNGFGTNNIERTFAFLAFASEQTVRDEFYSMTETFPLLRQRVSTLSEQLHNSKGIKALINAHSQRVRWHLHRIYRARNYIIHDAKIDNHMNQELVINLHSYVDIVFLEVISLISKSPYNDSIHDAIVEHKLSTLIMDERLENQENSDITAGNALQYLYYAFEL